MEHRSRKISLAVAAALLAAAAPAPAPAASPPAETPAPDTSAWACSKCPFDKGYASTAELGAGYVDEASAKFGDYTGLDEDGAYVVAGAEGRAVYESGYRIDYSLANLGLDSREASLEAGKQGEYEIGLSYDGVPHRIADTGESIYRGVGSEDLRLPAGWVRAGSTAGMTALGSTLRQVDVGYDRDRYGLRGSYLLGDNWTFGVDYRRDERSGTRPRFGSFGSVTTELLRPVDDSTDRIDASVRYAGKNWFAQAGYYLSLYDTKAAAFRWDNAFSRFGSFGGDVGQMALEPDNTYSEFAMSAGWYGLPGNTSVTASGAIGKGEQDTGFAPYTINPLPTLDPLPFSSLDGDVSVTRVDLALASQPMSRLRLRGALAYDERDNDSRQGTFTSGVHTDLFPLAEDRSNAVYGYERTRLYGSADYDVYDDLSVGVGGEWRKTDRTGTRVEVSSEETLDGWGRAQYRPTGYLGFVVKGGAEEREPDRYDTSVAIANGQNPLMRKYNQAYRYRSYGELLANVAVGELPVTLGASVYYGDDSYLQSDIGLDSGLDRRYGVDVNWAVSDKLSAYFSAGREKIDARMNNSSAFSWPDWRGIVRDDFETYGAGATAQVAEKFRLNLDFTYANGDTRTRVAGAASGSFPTVTSEMSSFKAGLTYAFNPRTDIVGTYWYETLSTRDWAYSASPTPLPTVLALGIDPYDYDVNVFTLSVRYRFGGPEPAKDDAAE